MPTVNPYVASQPGYAERSHDIGRRATGVMPSSNHQVFKAPDMPKPTQADGVGMPYTQADKQYLTFPERVKLATSYAMHRGLSVALREVCPPYRTNKVRFRIRTHAGSNGIMQPVASQVAPRVVTASSTVMPFVLKRYAIGITHNMETMTGAETPESKALINSLDSAVRNTAEAAILSAFMNSRHTASAVQYSGRVTSVGERREATLDYYESIGSFNRSAVKALQAINRAREALSAQGDAPTHIIMPSNAALQLAFKEDLRSYSATGNKTSLAKPIDGGRRIAGLKLFEHHHAGNTKEGKLVRCLDSEIEISSHGVARPGQFLKMFDFVARQYREIKRPRVSTFTGPFDDAGKLLTGKAEDYIMVAVRPFALLRTRSVILLSGGAEKMCLAFNHPIISSGQNAGYQQTFHQFSIFMAACLYQPTCIYVICDPIVDAVVRGASTKIFGHVLAAGKRELDGGRWKDVAAPGEAAGALAEFNKAGTPRRARKAYYTTRAENNGESVLIRYLDPTGTTRIFSEPLIDLSGDHGSGMTGNEGKDRRWSQNNKIYMPSQLPRTAGFDKRSKKQYTDSVSGEYKTFDYNGGEEKAAGYGPLTEELCNALRK